MKLRFARVDASHKDPRNWFESYIADDRTMCQCRSETWRQESRWLSKTDYHTNVCTSFEKNDPNFLQETCDEARRRALLSLPGGAWLAYRDGGATQVIRAGLEHCVLSDLLPTIANYLTTHTAFSLPEPAKNIHLCVSREFDFTNMTTDVTPEIIAKRRRDSPWGDRSDWGQYDAELWKIDGRSDVTFEYHKRAWVVSDNETTYMTRCSCIHSLLLSLRRSQILCEMWADVDLPDKSEAEYAGFKRAFGL